ncbi:MAG: hypothetical protein MJ250_08465 [Alphaproteobacteria bacterium]|nr:hypothetical protein [Alphaproteobacteria bacterium]
MASQAIIELIQTIGLPTSLSIYLLVSNSKQTEKYEKLIEQITGELVKLNENIKSFSQSK